MRQQQRQEVTVTKPTTGTIERRRLRRVRSREREIESLDDG